MKPRQSRATSAPEEWRQQARERYPDEPYGGDPSAPREPSEPISIELTRHSSRGEGYREPKDARAPRADYRGDFGEPSGAFRGRGPKGYQRSDERIREDIADRFTDDPSLDPTDVAIRVESGDVTLTGSVATRWQKHHAEDLAERVSGVRDVMNEIRVASPTG